MNEDERILIAYDGSAYAENAIDELARAGLPRRARALIVHVKEKWLPMPEKPEIGDEKITLSRVVAARMARPAEEREIMIGSEMIERLEQGKTKLQSHFPDWEIETLVLEGSPSSQILEQARTWKADLLVVGCQGVTDDKLYTFGSISQKIANEAPCSVRIVRGQVWKQGSPNRILIGLDGTGSMENVVRAVADRMWLMGSEVRLLMATDQPESETVEREKLWIEDRFATARKILVDTELKISEVIEQGNPKQIICTAADEWGADCIFIGANKSTSYIENLLLGSVSTAVVARANCTVEVVRQKRTN